MFSIIMVIVTILFVSFWPPMVMRALTERQREKDQEMLRGKQ